MAYVYLHTRLDNNQVFYVGIGSDSKGKYTRANCSKRRGKFWKDFTKNIPYEVHILLDNLTWKEACEKEIELIIQYGRRDLGTGCLINLTTGGEGVNGYHHTEEALAKLSNNSKGSKNSNSKKCIHFDTKLEFDCLKDGCLHFELKYITQRHAIRKRFSTAQFYYKDDYFDRPTRKDISEKLGKLRIGNQNSKKNWFKTKEEKNVGKASRS